MDTVSKISRTEFYCWHIKNRFVVQLEVMIHCMNQKLLSNCTACKREFPQKELSCILADRTGISTSTWRGDREGAFLTFVVIRVNAKNVFYYELLTNR